jgi:predicted LPLAT superfamily acyltransferase
VRLCVLIPVYNHGAQLATTLESISRYGQPVIVVDDGSDAEDERSILLATDQHAAELVRMPANLGKGGAVIEGLRTAGGRGFTHALQIDADGQHDSRDINRFIAAAKSNPTALIAGQPIFDESIPKSRLYGRRLTNFWVAIETLSVSVPDAMCGFRVYPLDSCLKLIESVQLTHRMDFDIEIMVRLAWLDVPIVPVSTRVQYFDHGVSHFRTWRDNWLITKLHTKLVMLSLWRLPMRIARRLAPRGVHWSRIGERGGVFGMRILFAVYRLLGRHAFRALLYPVMAYFYLAAGQARHASRQYLDRVLSHSAATQVQSYSHLCTFRHFLAFGDAVLDKVAMWAGASVNQPIRFDDPKAFAEFQSSNRGSFFIGSHLGNLEVLRAYGETQHKMSVNALVYTRQSAKFMKVLSEVNPSATERTIEVDSLGPDSILRMKAMIERGEHIAMVGDRTSVSHEGRSINTVFLGELAPFPEGPFIIAHLLACPVYLLFCLKQEGEYRIFLERFADPLELPRRGRNEAIASAVSRYAQRLEHYCLKAPLQWFNFFNFWRPPTTNKQS